MLRTRRGFSYTPQEQKLIARLDSPKEVQHYLNCLPYNWEKNGETLRSFRGVVAHQTAHCLEAVFFAAAILSEHGFPPLVLDLSSTDNLDHCLFLYKDGDCFGTVGISREPELFGKRARFSSVYQLIMSYFDDYVSEAGCIESYAVAQLDEIGRANWRFSSRNVWKVQDYLIELPHQSVRVAEERIEKIRQQITLPET